MMPRNAFDRAIFDGDVDAMRALLLEPVPWDELLGPHGDGVSQAIKTAIYDKGFDPEIPQVKQCINMLLDRADEDGEARPYVQFEGTFGAMRHMQPVLAFMMFDVHDLLLRYIAKGFDPEIAPEHHPKTAIEVATSLDKAEMVDLMKSAAARMRIEAILSSSSQVASCVPKACA